MPTLPFSFPFSFGFAPLDGFETFNDLEHEDDHCAAGTAQLLSIMRGRTRMDGVLCAILFRIQDAEDAVWQLLTERLISTSIGAQLDGIGDIVGQRRDGLSDVIYRAAIRGRIAANASHGKPDQVFNVAELVLDDEDFAMHIDERHPAGFALVLDDDVPDPVLAFIIADLMDTAVVSGVYIVVEFSKDVSKTWALSSGLGVTETSDDTGLGWSVDPSLGGGLAGAIAAG